MWNLSEQFFYTKTVLLLKKVTLEVNESRYKQCEKIPHFSTEQNLIKKLLKDKYWHDQLRKAFSTGQKLLKKILRKDK